MYRHLLFIFFIFFVHDTYAQLPVLEWAREFLPQPNNAPTLNSGKDIAIDKYGNVYTAGFLVETNDFDPGPGVFHLTAPDQEGSIFITKLNTKGELLWAKSVDVKNIKNTHVQAPVFEMDIDQNGNVFLTGYLRDKIDLDPGPGTYFLSPIGKMDAFILKLDTNGDFLWAKQFGGASASTLLKTLHIDPLGNIITTGGFNLVVDFDPGAGVSTLTSQVIYDIYVVKLTNDGNFIWANKLGDFDSAGSGVIKDLTTDSLGNIYVSGNFTGKADFDPGPAIAQLYGYSLIEGFVGKYDKDGNFIWVKHLGKWSSSVKGTIHHESIALDKNNAIYLTGSFYGTQDFNPAAGNILQNDISGSPSPFLAKLNDKGEFIWARKTPITGIGEGHDICVDTSGSIYMLSMVSMLVDFGPVTGYNHFDNGGNVNILSKFNTNGEIAYVAAFLKNGGFGKSLSIKSDPSANLYITGYAFGSIDLDPGLGEFLSANTSSGYVANVIKLNKCQDKTYSTLEVKSCYKYVFHGTTYDQSGTYFKTISNAVGCDSIITLKLTILDSSSTSITINACSEYNFNGKKLTVSGIYTDTLINAVGCDSIVTLKLNILRTSISQTKTICEGEYFISRGVKQFAAGIYIDTLKTYTGCDSIVTTTLIVNPKPKPDLGVDKRFCEGASIFVTPGVFSSYFWNDGSIKDTLVIDRPGQYFVTVSNTFGCRASDTLLVPSLYPSPSNFLLERDSICDYGKLIVSSLYTYKEYRWSSGIDKKEIEITKSGMYWLQVKDVNGCYGKDSIQIYLKQCLKGVFIPNAFTPNGDKRNDTFKAMVFGNLVSFKLQVFNQWGEEVFMTQDPLKSWNGMYKGILDKTQNYVWLCRYELENEPPVVRKGTVALIR